MESFLFSFSSFYPSSLPTIKGYTMGRKGNTEMEGKLLGHYYKRETDGDTRLTSEEKLLDLKNLINIRGLIPTCKKTLMGFLLSGRLFYSLNDSSFWCDTEVRALSSNWTKKLVLVSPQVGSQAWCSFSWRNLLEATENLKRKTCNALKNSSEIKLGLA